MFKIIYTILHSIHQYVLSQECLKDDYKNDLKNDYLVMKLMYKNIYLTKLNLKIKSLY
jgi:hypothetical protein